MLDRQELILSTGTVGNPALPDLVAAATAGGYGSVAVWPMDYARWRGEGISDAAARAQFDAAGVQVAQLDCMLLWTQGGSDRAQAEEADLFSVAETLGAPLVSLLAPTDRRCSVDQLAELMTGVCDRGRERGFDVALEISPWKHILDLPTAVQLIEQVGRDNAGLVLDSWHMYRGATGTDVVAAVPTAYVSAIQVSDAPAAAQADLVAETMGARLLPGQGDIDLTGFVRALEKADVQVTVEVLSDELRAVGPVEAARRSAAATRALLADALG